MENKAKRKFLIDCDPGVDDAQAILMALQCPDVDVIGITCVSGNAGARQVAKNTLRLLKVVDRLDVSIVHSALWPSSSLHLFLQTLKKRINRAALYCANFV